MLSIQTLRKTLGGRTLFDAVSFSVDEGEKVGVIGANGSGKSTLLRIVAGLEGIEDGSMALRRGASVGYLAQEPEFAPGESIRAAVAAGHPEMQRALGEYQEVSERLARGAGARDRLLARQGELMARIDALGGWDWQHRAEAMLTRLGVERWDRPVEGLSGGERKRVALARALLQSPDLLLLDEPTNHLDADTTLWLEEHLVDHPGAVLLVTHDRYFLDRVVSRMLEVERGVLTTFPGGYTEYLEARAERQERLAVEEEKRAKLIRQELAWVRRSPAARTGKQKARIQRLEATQAEGAERQLPVRESAEIRFGEPPRLGRTVLDLQGIRKAYGERTLIEGFSAQLRAGERIGIIGPNGAGKTTLLRVILGEVAPDAGEVAWGKNTRAAYFDQARRDLDPGASVLETVSGQDWVSVSGERVHVRSYLERFLFPTSMHEQRVRSLSGGERSRLLLARLLLEEANLLILDEPTNDLDLVTLQVLESALVDFPGCVLVVTHDRFFLDKVATGLLVFEGEGRIQRHEGNYELYRRLREEQASAEPERSRPAARAPARTRAAEERPRRLSYLERRELEGMEAAILAAEEERDRHAELLSDPSLYADTPERVAEVTTAFRAASERVERLYARWAELEEIGSRAAG